MPYWACAQLENNRERLALHCLGLAGFTTYLRRLRIKRVTPTRKAVLATPALFPGYCFVLIELQWHTARWSPGVIRLVLDGVQPARVPDQVIVELKGRERHGLIDLPKPPGLRRGDRVRVMSGPFRDRLGLFEGRRRTSASRSCSVGWAPSGASSCRRAMSPRYVPAELLRRNTLGIADFERRLRLRRARIRVPWFIRSLNFGVPAESVGCCHQRCHPSGAGLTTRKIQ